MAGYYQTPTISGDTIVFVAEDDLWEVSVEGGLARRLTTSVGAVGTPRFSPDGSRIAFTGREEGAWEVYVMSARGSVEKRLTFQGASAAVASWTPEGDGIIYASAHIQPFLKKQHLWQVNVAGGAPEMLPFGVASRISFGPSGAVVLGRHAGDPARWKRYRGGTAGHLWVDQAGTGEFDRLRIDGNVTAPMWLGGRIYHISDHEGVGNIYSCLPDGSDLRRHTHHAEFYARNAQTDGRRIVYHAGAAIYLLDPDSGESRLVDIEFHSPSVQRRRRFVDAAKYLQEFTVHPDGHTLALTSRGQLFVLANWEGPIHHLGEREGVRYRLPRWIKGGKRLLCVSDEGGEEALEIHTVDGTEPPVRMAKLDLGRITGIHVSPKSDLAAIRNHRFELIVVDLKKQKAKVIDRSPYGAIAGIAWSPDGKWIAYGFSSTERTTSIKIAGPGEEKPIYVTPPEFNDGWPAWDPDGKYLYFLSRRFFNPVYDALHFELGFPKAMRPMLVTLRSDLPNPFLALPVQDPPKPDEDKPKKRKKKDEEKPLEIEFDGIQDRVLAFPVPEGRYGQIAGLPGKALYTTYPIEGSVNKRWDRDDEGKGTIMAWTFATLREDTLISGVSNFALSRDLTTLAYSTGKRLRVVRAGEKPPDSPDKNANIHDRGRSSGWIDLKRIRVPVTPLSEWRQMFREAWRLQREHFWTENMSGVDWGRVYDRYRPLVERVATRGEFSDLMWEMQGELGTSHAYEMGGDYRLAPHVSQGLLGADLRYDDDAGGYRVDRLVRGDSWDEGCHSPLLTPGADVREGDVIVAAAGQRASARNAPEEFLVNQGDQEVELAVKRGEDAPRKVTVTALRSETPLRYRAWVNGNRDFVHPRSGGLVGYVHVPDMSALGYAEFHRGWLSEIQYPGLIIDVRYNGGGHVSQLLLEKLARRRLGYDITRWGHPVPYPVDSVLGPMAAITNENAGSDGDMFSHAFKMLKLGPLIGQRTWGGVIGITRNQFLVDGSLTTQPEYAIWFEDVGWRVENYGTDPDIDVDMRPQDYRDGKDPQLEKAVALLVEEMEKHPPAVPDFGDRPYLPLPELPKQ
ncbi:MAG: PDZ domain-containing protein [Candidatus Hydrogenedentes bacterium]|nr:PDZ domain-containing protein [Candidatus Hydrogenedentota bacterium]